MSNRLLSWLFFCATLLGWGFYAAYSQDIGGGGGGGGGITQADADTRYVNASGDSMSGALDVATTLDVGTGNAFTVTAAGLVGIGDATPDYELDIERAQAAPTAIFVTNTSTANGANASVCTMGATGTDYGCAGYIGPNDSWESGINADAYVLSVGSTTAGGLQLFSFGPTPIRAIVKPSAASPVESWRVEGETGVLVVNESGTSSVDLRVEGDTLTHLLFTDASADRVGIADSTPDATLDVGGTLTADGLITSGGGVAVGGALTGATTGAFSGAVGFADGTVGAPSIAFTSDADGSGTGIYRSGNNTLDVATNGVSRMTFGATGIITVPVELKSNGNTTLGDAQADRTVITGSIASGGAAGSGTSGTCSSESYTGNNIAGTITATCTAGQTVIMSWNATRTAAPLCTLTPTNAAASAAGSGVAYVSATSTTGLTVTVPTATTAGTWNYVCIE